MRDMAATLASPAWSIAGSIRAKRGSRPTKGSYVNNRIDSRLSSRQRAIFEKRDRAVKLSEAIPPGALFYAVERPIPSRFVPATWLGFALSPWTYRRRWPAPASSPLAVACSPCGGGSGPPICSFGLGITRGRSQLRSGTRRAVVEGKTPVAVLEGPSPAR
jgi:hypothetical protein